MNKPSIVLQTDFEKGISTCTMEGVIQMLDPELKTFDANHDVTPFDTYEASFCLYYIVPFWPEGTIFVSVVDPGVGTDRRAVVAKLSNGCYVVTPDNGSLTHMKKFVGIEAVRIIDEERNRLQSTKNCSIFHGRDLFANCAGKLASGKIAFEEVGPEYDVADIIEHEMIEPTIEGDKVSGMLESADRHFGLICSNIPCEVLQTMSINCGDPLRCIISHQGQTVLDEEITYEKSFGYVKEGAILAMISETMQLQIARNLGNLSDEYRLGSGPQWLISFEKLAR